MKGERTIKPPIYKPSGRAGEYGDYALNIYTGCPHECKYCFAPKVLRQTADRFHDNIKPRKNIIEETEKCLKNPELKGKLIHLCFTCDPLPRGCDITPTVEIIKRIKAAGANVQLLTKNDPTPVVEYLDENDWVGITYAGTKLHQILQAPDEEPGAAPVLDRLCGLLNAHKKGIHTWVSMEPVLNADEALRFLKQGYPYIDRYKIGKLNYHPSDIDWAWFGKEAEAICISNGYDYYIKEDLRKCMCEDI